MIFEKLFYGPNPWLILFASLAFFLCVFAVGYRLGKRAKDKIDEPTKSWIITVDQVMLGMLSLLLAFSFSMAEQRFDARKRLVIEEANAIGTTYLRAQWLPEPQRTEISKLLREYVDLRLPFDVQTLNYEAFIQKNVALSDKLQAQLWLHAVEIAKNSPSPIAVLFIGTLNETIDLQTKRLAAFNNHVPGLILLLLYLFAAFSILVTAYVSAFRSHHGLFAVFTMVGLLTFFLFVSVDLDRPRQGLITVSQESLIGVQKKLHADLAPPSVRTGQ